MKRHAKQLKKDYLPLVINLDDLVELEKLLKEAGCRPTFITEDTSFDSVAELESEIKSFRIKQLEVNSGEPHYLRLWLAPVLATLNVTAHTNAAVGVFYKVDEWAKKRLRKPWLLYSYYSFWVLWSSYCLASGAHIMQPWVQWCLFSLVMSWAAWSFFVRFTRHGLVLRQHATILPFWTRNRDTLGVAVTSAVVGAILGICGTLVSTKISGLMQSSRFKASDSVHLTTNGPTNNGQSGTPLPTK